MHTFVNRLCLRFLRPHDLTFDPKIAFDVKRATVTIYVKCELYMSSFLSLHARLYVTDGRTNGLSAVLNAASRW